MPETNKQEPMYLVLSSSGDSMLPQSEYVRHLDERAQRLLAAGEPEQAKLVHDKARLIEAE